MLHLVRRLQAAQGLESFSRQLVRGLRSLISADHVSYNDVDVAGEWIVPVTDPAGVVGFPGSLEIFGKHMHENPLIAHFSRCRDERWLRISDFVSRRTFERTTLYSEYYRKVYGGYQIATMFPADGSRAVGIALNRGLRDFQERDRTRLTLLYPHVIQGYRNALRFTELQADIASITSGVDSARVGLIVLGENRDIRLATTRARSLLSTYFSVEPRAVDALPAVLDGWVHHHETSGLDLEVPEPRTPYVVDRDDTRLIVRLIGEQPRRLLVCSEERLGVDRQALEAFGLTRREAVVLAWLAEGKRDQEIAVILAISPRTVQHHLEHIYDELGVETRNAAVAMALRASTGSLPL